MWTAEEEVWASLIENNPEAKKWKTTPLPAYYNKLVSLFGQDRATGEGSMTAKEAFRRTSPSNEPSEIYEDTIQQIDELISQNQVTMEPFENGINHFQFNEVDRARNTLSQRPKKKAKLNDNSKDINFLKEALQSVTEAIEKNVILIEKSQSSYLMKELYTELEAMSFDR
ncbi:unnamed protein product [Victoria cruziana]